MKLQEIFTTEEWDRLLGSFKTVLGIAPITIDATGNPLTTACFTCEACRMIKSTAEGARRCKEGHQQMVGESKATRRALVKFCHAKFLKVTIPIFDGEEFLGMTGGCNILPEKAQADEAFLLGLAKELGIDGKQLVEAAQKARRVSSAVIEMQIRTLDMRIKAKMRQMKLAARTAFAAP